MLFLSLLKQFYQKIHRYLFFVRKHAVLFLTRFEGKGQFMTPAYRLIPNFVYVGWNSVLSSDVSIIQRHLSLSKHPTLYVDTGRGWRRGGEARIIWSRRWLAAPSSCWQYSLPVSSCPYLPPSAPNTRGQAEPGEIEYSGSPLITLRIEVLLWACGEGEGKSVRIGGGGELKLLKRRVNWSY